MGGASAQRGGGTVSATTLKTDPRAAVREGGWVLYWHPGRQVYVVRPDTVDGGADGDEFGRMADALAELRAVVRAQREPAGCSTSQRAHCERCGEPLHPDREVWLELDQVTNLYHRPEAFPKGGVSQGGFAFGVACARAVLRAGGRCVRPRSGGR